MKCQPEILASREDILEKFQSFYKSMTKAFSMFSMSTFIKRGFNFI